MPDLGDEPQLWWLEGILGRYPDVDLVVPVLVRCVGRAEEVALEACEVGDVGGAGERGDGDAAVGVLEDIGDLFLHYNNALVSLKVDYETR